MDCWVRYAFGLDGIGTVEKESMRQLAMSGGPYTDADRLALLDYCQTDVDALARLLLAMLPKIDVPRALFRGRYTAAAARMEWNGVPLDVEALARLRGNWDAIKGELVTEIDSKFGIYEPADRRTIDPKTRRGAALLQTAAHWGIDPHDLATAVDKVWNRRRELTARKVEAVQAARLATGLTAGRIKQWENAGQNHTTWPHFDVIGLELAAQWPELDIGRGGDREAPDEDDPAAKLWKLLRDHAPAPLPRHHPEILREAAELVSDAGPAPTHRGPMRFSAARFAAFLTRTGIAWPKLPSGALALDDDTFREMAKAYPAEIGPLRELRHALGQLRLNELALGGDGRNRVLLSVFGSKTGRNQPSNTRFVFGPSCWLRSLIKPAPGRAIGYVDWSQQELAIAAALSQDPKMLGAYVSGDFYLTFAKMAGAVPSHATKKTHPHERDQFKTVALGVLYGLSGEGLARKLSLPSRVGLELLRLHQKTFTTFWEWSNAVETQAMLKGLLQTNFGWTLHVGPDANPRSIRNFPMQGNGAEMMRLACCLATERGIQVCAPIHDALLVEGPSDGIEAVVTTTRRAMAEASELVLPGFPLRTDAKIVRYPDRYVDERGRQMWNTVSRLLDALDTPCTGAETLEDYPPHGCGHTPSTGAYPA